jgi:3-oxoacyl-[acyl-carrier-protein] synthase III
MNKGIYSVITGTGSYIPTEHISNDNFISNKFYSKSGEIIDKNSHEIVEKFLDITTIKERRYVTNNLVTSDIAFFAAQNAVNSAGIDKEELDYIIVAHNFGDVKYNNKQVDIVPSIAARVKNKFGIRNPYTVAYDLPFGCPGWLQALIQANYYIKSGDANKILIIGADTLSRVCDPHDRDSMLYADGAGATILESKRSDNPVGVLSQITRSDTLEYSKMLFMGNSCNPEYKNKEELFLKMNGRKLYQYAIENVPQTIKMCIEKSGVGISDINKMLFHQANGKMDDAILKRLYGLYNINNIPEGVMPMTISRLGNSSVATIPTLLDLILKNKISSQSIKANDLLVFASVGAGMNINSVVYRSE